jgi:hypothetical protein
MLNPPQKKYKPTIAKLGDGTSGINERPAMKGKIGNSVPT